MTTRSLPGLFAGYRLRMLAKRALGRSRGDDFYWEDYNLRYRAELDWNERHYTQSLAPGDYELVGGSLVMKHDGLRPLHPNPRLLYETILQLAPESAFELGCGGGDHLHNLNVLSPEIKLRAIDRDEKQLAFAHERHPDLAAETMPFDATLPLPVDFPSSDLAFTQAVLMHIQLGNGHLVALSNLFRAATEHVVLMERWTRHDYVGDILRLADDRVIPWSELHFHYRESPELGRPHLLVVSRRRLAYPELTSMEQLAVPAA